MNELKKVFVLEDVFYSEQLRALKSRPCFEYENGVKTENRVATFVEVVDLATFDKYEIKMPIGNEITEQKIINISDLINFKASLYVRNKRIYWSLKADGIGV